jgi:hypothetical protein
MLMYKRPTPRPLVPDRKNIKEGNVLYKGISNSSRVYNVPVFFAISKNYASQYAKARLGEYVVKKPLKLLKLTSRTVKYILAHADFSQLNKNRLAFMMGYNMTVGAQIALLNKIINNQGNKNYRKGVMNENLKASGKSYYNQGGRKSFMNLDLVVYKALCAFCSKQGYDGIYVDELSSPYHPRFGAELVLCNPKNALVNVNFPLRN